MIGTTCGSTLDNCAERSSHTRISRAISLLSLGSAIVLTQQQYISQESASEIGVEAETSDGDGAANLVIARIIDMLKIERSEEPAPKVRGVETLDDFFGSVGIADGRPRTVIARSLSFSCLQLPRQ